MSGDRFANGNNLQRGETNISEISREKGRGEQTLRDRRKGNFKNLPKKCRKIAIEPGLVKGLGKGRKKKEKKKRRARGERYSQVQK